MTSLLNFGFDPTGTALGSEGSPSMPMSPMTGLEDPMASTQQMLGDYVEEVQQRYGSIEGVAGSVWDPRGDKALTENASDYKTTNLVRPDEVQVQLYSDSAQQVGAPVPQIEGVDTAPFARALYGSGIGLSEQGAVSLAESFATYDPRILDTIYMPRNVEPQVTNELGLTSAQGGLPQAFFESGSGYVKQGVNEALTRVVSRQGEYQHVDENGVVYKYDDGTTPYDMVRLGRMGALSKPSQGQTAAWKRMDIKHMAGRLANSVKMSSTSVLNQPNTSATRALSAAASLASGGTPQPIDTTGDSAISNAGATPSTSSGGTYGSASSGYTNGGGMSSIANTTSYGTDSVSDGGVPVSDSEVSEPTETAASKWWLWLVLGGVAAGGAYLALRKKGKRK